MVPKLFLASGVLAGVLGLGGLASRAPADYHPGGCGARPPVCPAPPRRPPPGPPRAPPPAPPLPAPPHENPRPERHPGGGRPGPAAGAARQGAVRGTPAAL